MAREFLTGIKSENRLSKVRLIMPNDPVIGGQPSDNADEFTSNTPFLDLACSIQYSLNEVAKKANSTVNITAGNGLSGGGTLAANRTITLGTPTKITATSTNSVTTTSHTHEIDNASLTVAGVVKLNSATNSTLETEAATPSAVKTVMDAVGTKANSTVSITAGNGLSGGGTLAATRTITLGTPTKITATSTNSVTTTSHTHEIDNASTTVTGVVRLNNTVTSTSTTQAATANAVKLAYDKASNVARSVYSSNLAGSRILNVTYTNNTGKDFDLVITSETTIAYIGWTIFVDGISMLVNAIGGSGGNTTTTKLISSTLKIPADSSYRVQTAGVASEAPKIMFWFEG